jgi:hypothetical protein
MADEKREITGIRSAPTHTENPFLDGSTVDIRGRKKRYTVAARGDVLIDPNGQVKGGIEHSIVRVVDDAQFVKVFSDGIAGMYDLRSGGSKVFRYLFDQVQKHANVDRLYLYFMDAAEEPWVISKPVFFRGMAELLDKGFIARSANPNMYYLNPAMIWNGDRFRFVQEYQRAKQPKPVAAHSNANQQQLKLEEK